MLPMSDLPSRPGRIYPILSVLVLVMFGAALYLVMSSHVLAGQSADMLLGALASMSATVVNYWFGSSAGSARKNEILAQQQRQSGS